MKVWDRHAGQEVELPATVESGRFEVLAPCVLNGHTSLDIGDILWGDGNVCLYDVVAYWYQACGGEDPYEPLPLSERLGYYLEPQ